MDLKIISDHNEVIQYADKIPPQIIPLFIEGSEKVYADGDFGSMLFQQITGNDCAIWYSSYNMVRPVSFQREVEMPVLELHFTFKNDFHCTLGGIGAIVMEERQFNLTYTPYIESKTVFHAGNYETFDVHVSSAFLNKAAIYYPAVNNLINNIDKHKAAMLSKINHYASGSMLFIIQQILSCQYQGMLKQLYVETKVMELFLLAMDKVTSNPLWNQIVLKPYDIEKIREAKDILLAQMDTPVTVIALAHQVGINDFKLKKGFKQIFGTTIFDYLLQARMEKAVELLTSTTIPVTEIAFIVGYQTIGAFTNTFKKHFGYPPTSLRKH